MTTGRRAERDYRAYRVADGFSAVAAVGRARAKKSPTRRRRPTPASARSSAVAAGRQPPSLPRAFSCRIEAYVYTPDSRLSAAFHSVCFNTNGAIITITILLSRCARIVTNGGGVTLVSRSQNVGRGKNASVVAWRCALLRRVSYYLFSRLNWLRRYEYYLSDE